MVYLLIICKSKLIFFSAISSSCPFPLFNVPLTCNYVFSDIIPFVLSTIDYIDSYLQWMLSTIVKWK